MKLASTLHFSTQLNIIKEILLQLQMKQKLRYASNIQMTDSSVKFQEATHRCKMTTQQDRI